MGGGRNELRKLLKSSVRARSSAFRQTRCATLLPGLFPLTPAALGAMQDPSLALSPLRLQRGERRRM